MDIWQLAARYMIPLKAAAGPPLPRYITADPGRLRAEYRARLEGLGLTDGQIGALGTARHYQVISEYLAQGGRRYG